MAVDIADGPLGLEALHIWNGAVTLNATSGGPPRVVLDDIAGLHDLPDADDNRQAGTGRDGEVPLPSLRLGKTVVYSGRVQGRTLAELRSMSNLLRAGFAERSDEGSMLIQPNAAYGSVAWRYRARVIACQIPERQERGPGAQPTPWQRQLTLSLRMSDARFYLDGSGEGGSGFADGSTHTVTNQGIAPTDPVLTGDPTGATVTFENLSVDTGDGTARLRFTGLPAADLITVTFAATPSATLTIGGVVFDAMPYFDSSFSQWWDERIPGLKPGANDVKATGVSAWGVSFASASW